MRGLPSLILLVAIVGSTAGCTKKSAPPPAGAASENPPSAIEAVASPVPVAPPVVNCEPRAISAEFAAVAKAEKDRGPLEAATKTSPSPENLRALLDYDRALANLAERARLTTESCAEVPATELKKLRAVETAARSNILYLEESLPASAR